MSVIVGMVRDGTVFMGAESFEGNGGSSNSSVMPKLFRTGNVVLGFCGDSSAKNAVRHRMTEPDRAEEETDEHYMAVTFVDAMREALRGAGRLHKEYEVETAEAWALVGYRGHLYKIGYDFSVSATNRGYDAVGAGADLALGALHVLHAKRVAPRRILRAALDAACEHSPWCRGPYVWDTLTEGGKSG